MEKTKDVGAHDAGGVKTVVNGIGLPEVGEVLVIMSTIAKMRKELQGIMKVAREPLKLVRRLRKSIDTVGYQKYLCSVHATT